MSHVHDVAVGVFFGGSWHGQIHSMPSETEEFRTVRRGDPPVYQQVWDRDEVFEFYSHAACFDGPRHLHLFVADELMMESSAAFDCGEDPDFHGFVRVMVLRSDGSEIHLSLWGEDVAKC